MLFSICKFEIIGIAYDYYDGHQPHDKLSSDSKKVALVKRPGLLEVFGHCFFPAAFLIGPQFPMKRYQEFVAGKYSKKVFIFLSSASKHNECVKFLGCPKLCARLCGCSGKEICPRYCVPYNFPST